VFLVDFVTRLDGCSNYACIFELVKEAVEKTMNKRRAGLILGLTNLPNHVGAFHQMSSNFIVMNKRLLEKVVESGDKKLINSYIFHVLLHEYIHSLGYMNEQETQILTHVVSEKVLGPTHPATVIAVKGIGSVFSNIKGLRHQNFEGIEDIEIVEEFERDNLNYFG
jgi:hypothetical protein